VNLFYYQGYDAGHSRGDRGREFADFADMTRDGWARGDIPPP